MASDDVLPDVGVSSETALFTFIIHDRIELVEVAGKLTFCLSHLVTSGSRCSSLPSACVSWHWSPECTRHIEDREICLGRECDYIIWVYIVQVRLSLINYTNEYW